MSAPKSAGGRTIPRVSGSTPTMVSAPCWRAIRAISAALGLEQAEIGWRFEIDRRGLGRYLVFQIVDVDQARFEIDLHAPDLDVIRHVDRLAVILHHRQALGIEHLRDDDLAPLGQARRHAQGMADGAAPGIDRQPDHFHVQELAELARILEPSLVAAEVGLRRAPDRSQELGPPDDLIHHCRHVMRPAARAEKGEVGVGALVLGEHVGKMPTQSRFRLDAKRKVERLSQPMILRDLLEQGLDRADADLVQHLLLQGGQGIPHPGMTDRVLHHHVVLPDLLANRLVRFPAFLTLPPVPIVYSRRIHDPVIGKTVYPKSARLREDEQCGLWLARPYS